MHRLYRKLARNLRRHGLSGTLQVAGRVLLGRHEVNHSRDFDASHGTDTGGYMPIPDLPQGYQEPPGGVYYQATPPGLFAEVMASLPPSLSDFTFVDIGSGKGMALLLAAAYPFRRIIGVELSQALHEVAEDNIRNFKGATCCRDIRSLCANALEFPIPDGPLVIYLFNPFPGEVVDRLLDRLWQSLAAAPRETFIIYMNPAAVSVFRKQPRLEPLAINAEFALYHYQPAGLSPARDNALPSMPPTAALNWQP